MKTKSEKSLKCLSERGGMSRSPRTTLFRSRMLELSHIISNRERLKKHTHADSYTYRHLYCNLRFRKHLRPDTCFSPFSAQYTRFKRILAKSNRFWKRWFRLLNSDILIPTCLISSLLPICLPCASIDKHHTMPRASSTKTCRCFGHSQNFIHFWK